MPRSGKGARLWLRPARRDASGIITHPAVYLIRDGRYSESTRCGRNDRELAERRLGEYIARKHVTNSAIGKRHPSSIPVADVLALYARDIAPAHARPKETAQRISQLLRFFGAKLLSEVNGARCREYVAQRTSTSSARKELEDLRAAVNHHRREGLCSEIISVTLPEASVARERWLTREEAAHLLLTAWRHRERQGGSKTRRWTRRHVAKFILVALYTGSRASVICRAALQPTEGQGWIDLTRGVFYRRAQGVRETKKRTPPIPLPLPLLAHLRRWKRQGQSFAVEWNRKQVGDVDKAFRSAVRAAGLDSEVTPHTLRHTAATWQMQAGTDLWEAAGYLGMTVEMLSQRYGHHHPKHLTGARDAYRRHRDMTRKQMAG